MCVSCRVQEAVQEARRRVEDGQEGRRQCAETMKKYFALIR